MRYVTQDGYAARFSRDELLALTDHSGKGEPDPEVWEAAARDAEAEVDTALAARYALPLEHVPDAVQWAAYACLRARLNPHVSEGPAREHYDDARQWLKRVARGEVGLGLPQEQAEEIGAPRPAVSGGGPRFTREALLRLQPEVPRARRR